MCTRFTENNDHDNSWITDEEYDQNEPSHTNNNLSTEVTLVNLVLQTQQSQKEFTIRIMDYFKEQQVAQQEFFKNMFDCQKQQQIDQNEFIKDIFQYQNEFMKKLFHYQKEQSKE